MDELFIEEAMQRDTAAQARARRFVIRFGMWCLQVYAWRSFGLSCLVLADLGGSWHIKADFVRTLFKCCRLKKVLVRASVEKRCPQTTANPSTIGSKLRTLDPSSIKRLPTSHIKSIRIDSEKIDFDNTNGEDI